jgi:hypothetical protein
MMVAASYGIRKMVVGLQRPSFLALLIAAALFLARTAHGDDNPLRTYFVGKSVTDTIRCGSQAQVSG